MNSVISAEAAVSLNPPLQRAVSFLHLLPEEMDVFFSSARDTKATREAEPIEDVLREISPLCRSERLARISSRPGGPLDSFKITNKNLDEQKNNTHNFKC